MATYPPKSGPQKPCWTIMIYMAADNILYRSAVRSLHQIKNSQPMDAVNVVVQLEGPKTGHIIRYVRHHGTPSFKEQPVVSSQIRQVQLRDFVIWSIEHEPARQYMLVLWGHGDGLDRIYIYKKQMAEELAPAYAETICDPEKDCSLEQPNLKEGLRQLVEKLTAVLHAGDANVYIHDTQIAQVLKNFPEKTGAKLNLIGFDACLMGMAEVCSELEDSADFCLASATVIPDHSWPYDRILADLARNPAIDSKVASALIAARYVESYSKRTGRRAVELSSFDLSVTQKLEEAMGQLVESLTALISADGQAKSVIAKARDETGVSRLERDYCDLFAFCVLLRESFRNGDEVGRKVSEAADGVIDVLLFTPEIVYHDHSHSREMKDFRGLSFYFPRALPQPTDNVSPGSDKTPPHSGKGEIISYHVIWSDYIQLKFCKTTRWPEFLVHFLGPEQSKEDDLGSKKEKIMLDKSPPHSGKVPGAKRKKKTKKGKKDKTPPHSGKSPARRKRRRKK